MYVFLTVVSWLLCNLYGIDHTIVISKETTYVTEPIATDGLPNFEAYLLEQGFRGVTPENNAAALVWQAIWPGKLAQEYQVPMCNALGMEMPSPEDSLVDVHDSSVYHDIADWLATRKVAPAEMTDDEWRDSLADDYAVDVVDRARHRPWTGKQAPPLANWARENAAQLDLLIEASQRPQFYSPCPNHLVGSTDGLVGSLLTMEEQLRGVSRALSVRAMWYLGESRPADAWQQLRANLQFAQFVSQGWCLIQQLVAIAIENQACELTVVLLHDNSTPPELAQRVLEDLQTLPVLPRFFTFVDRGERLTLIDSTLAMATGRNDAMGTLGGDEMRYKVDWTYILVDINQFFDQIVATAELPSRKQRLDAWRELEEHLLYRLTSKRNLLLRVKAYFSRSTQSQLVADVMLSLLTPSVEAGMTAQDRADSRRNLTILAAALAVYRTQHGEYPESLAALVPHILPEMPLDLYSEKTFLYERKQDGGYLLYSVFENGVDDGGTDYRGEIVNGEWVDQPQEVDFGKSDLVVRVPVPPFRLPEPPTTD